MTHAESNRKNRRTLTARILNQEKYSKYSSLIIYCLLGNNNNNKTAPVGVYIPVHRHHHHPREFTANTVNCRELKTQLFEDRVLQRLSEWDSAHHHL